MSRAKGNSSGAGLGVQAFSNPMYAANEPQYSDAAGVELATSSGYMDVNASSGYMDVNGGPGYTMDMSDA